MLALGGVHLLLKVEEAKEHQARVGQGAHPQGAGGGWRGEGGIGGGQ